MIAWNIDDYETREEGDLKKALDAIGYIGNVLRPKVFSLIWIGPGHAGGFPNKKELADGGKEKWDTITEQLKTRWTAHGMSRWDGVLLSDKLPRLPGNKGV